MANQQIVDYIKENLSGNISIEHIKKSLLDAGWPEQEVEEAIRGTEGISPRKETPPLPEKNSQKTSILAILSLIFAFIFTPAGLILGIIALSEIKKNPSLKGRGLAIAGIIISIILMILVLIPTLVLFLIGGLAYSGFLSPSSYLSPRCTLPMDLSCNEFSVVSGNPGSISLTLESGMGEGIMIRSIKITELNSYYDCYIDLKTDSPGGPDNYEGLDGWHLAHGESENVKLICPIEQSDIKTKGNITIVYCDDRSPNNEECQTFLHTLEGTLVADVR